MAATHRIRTWPLNPGRRYGPDEQMVWTLLPLSIMERLPMIEARLRSRLHEPTASRPTPTPHSSIDWLFFPGSLNSRRSTSLDPEPSLGDRVSNFNRGNSATPEGATHYGSQNDFTRDLINIGAVVEPPTTTAQRCAATEGLLTPTTQSTMTLSSPPHRFVPRSRSGSATPTLSAVAVFPLSHAVAISFSSLSGSSHPPTEVPGSPQTSRYEAGPRPLTRSRAATGSSAGQSLRDSRAGSSRSARAPAIPISKINEEVMPLSSRVKRARSPDNSADGSAMGTMNRGSHKRAKPEADEASDSGDLSDPPDSDANPDCDGPSSP